MEKNESGHGNFSTGFLLGLLIGAAIVFFLGTEKGRKIVKTLTESGLDKFSDLESVFEDGDEFEREAEGVEESSKEHSLKKGVKKFFKKPHS